MCDRVTQEFIMIYSISPTNAVSLVLCPVHCYAAVTSYIGLSKSLLLFCPSISLSPQPNTHSLPSIQFCELSSCLTLRGLTNLLFPHPQHGWEGNMGRGCISLPPPSASYYIL